MTQSLPDDGFVEQQAADASSADDGLAQTTSDESDQSGADDASAAADNEPYRVFLEALGVEALRDFLKARRAQVGDAAFAAAVGEPDSYDRVLAEMGEQHGQEVTRVLRAIATVSDRSTFDTKLRRDGKTILGTPKPQRPQAPGGVVSGPDAIATFSLLTGRTKRLPLYNSGFAIDVTEPDLAALNTFMSKQRKRLSEYGRMFGSYFFYFHALMIKEAFVELFRPLVLHATLKNWNRDDTLLRAIKLVDLKLILNGIAAGMYPEGYEFTHVCTAPAENKCAFHERQMIDLTKLPHHDFKKLPEDCIQHMARQTVATPETLAAYHKSLGFDGRVIRHGAHGFQMQMPSIIDHLEYGRIYNGTLASNLYADTPDAVETAVLYSYYRIYTPFIASYTLHDEDGDVAMVVNDREAIATILSQLQKEDRAGALAQKFDAFIADTEISHICYAANPCPSCGHVPEGGYYTVDPEYTFFILLLTKLTQS